MIKGNFHNDTSLNSVTVTFREGVGWFIDSVWHDKTVKPKIGEFIVCIHEKGKLMGILQEDQVLYHPVQDVFCIVSVKQYNGHI